jgi:hypothetical protein
MGALGVRGLCRNWALNNYWRMHSPTGAKNANFCSQLTARVGTDGKQSSRGHPDCQPRGMFVGAPARRRDFYPAKRKQRRSAT